jgi:hypothetical protein
MCSAVSAVMCMVCCVCSASLLFVLLHRILETADDLVMTCRICATGCVFCSLLFEV